jgi:hypothetical protein
MGEDDDGLKSLFWLSNLGSFLSYQLLFNGRASICMYILIKCDCIKF